MCHQMADEICAMGFVVTAGGWAEAARVVTALAADNATLQKRVAELEQESQRLQEQMSLIPRWSVRVPGLGAGPKDLSPENAAAWLEKCAEYPPHFWCSPCDAVPWLRKLAAAVRELSVPTPGGAR